MDVGSRRGDRNSSDAGCSTPPRVRATAFSRARWLGARRTSRPAATRLSSSTILDQAASTASTEGGRSPPPQPGAESVDVVGVPGRGREDPIDGGVRDRTAPARYARLPHEGPIVGRADAIEGHLSTQAVQRPVLILEHRRQQVSLAAREQVRDVSSPLHRVPDSAFRAMPRRPGFELAELLELVEHDHRPAPVHARRPIESEQHLGDSLHRLSRRRQPDAKAHRAEGEFGFQRPERLGELPARSPALRHDAGAEPLDRRLDSYSQVLHVMHDEQIDRRRHDLAPVPREILKPLLDKAGLSHAASAPEPRMRAGEDVPRELGTFLLPVAVCGAGGDAERKQVGFGGHVVAPGAIPVGIGTHLSDTAYTVAIYNVPLITGTGSLPRSAFFGCTSDL